MDPALEKLVNLIKDRELRKKVSDFLRYPELRLRGIRGRTGLPFEESPAGISHHHAYRGGLVQHTVAMTKLALSLCDVIEKVYGGKVNRDVVIAGSLLHDIMKAPTYLEEEDRYIASPLGERLNHLSLLIAELYRRKFPLDVIHAAVAHHGEHGPISPRTIEALIVHVADMADSQLNGAILDAARYLIRDATGEEVRRIDLRDAFNVIYAKNKLGRKGVQKVWERAKKRRMRFK